MKTSKTEKEPFYKKKWFIAIAALIIIGAIFGPKDKDKNETPEPAKVEDHQEEVKEEVKEEDEFAITDDMSDEEKIENILKSEIGKGYESYEVSKKEDGSIGQITVNSYYEILSTKKELMMSQNSKATKVLMKFRENNINYSYYVQNTYTDFTDEYGNEKKDEVMHIYIPREEADKINFDNFNEDNIKEISDEYYIHPSFK